MQLVELSRKAELVKIILDDQETIDKYGEALEFYTYDRAPLDVFLKLSTAQAAGNANDATDTLRTLILDEKGNQILKGDKVLPVTETVKAMAKVMGLLGN